MQTYRNLYTSLCSYENIFLAYKKAKKGKSLKPYVIEFEKKFNQKLESYKNKVASYEDFFQSLQGWFGYAMWANTYKLRKNLMKKMI